MSLRKDSFNQKLIVAAQKILSIENTSHQYEAVLFNDFSMPIYDGDLETLEGIPNGVLDILTKKIRGWSHWKTRLG